MSALINRNLIYMGGISARTELISACNSAVCATRCRQDSRWGCEMRWWVRCEGCCPSAVAAAGDDSDTIVLGRATTIARCLPAENYIERRLCIPQREHNERRTGRVAGCIDRVIDGSGHQVDLTTSGRRWLPVGARLYCPRDGRTQRQDDGRTDKWRSGSGASPTTSSRANFLIELSTTTSVDGVGVDWSAGTAVRRHWSAARRRAGGCWRVHRARQCSEERRSTSQLDENCIRATRLAVCIPYTSLPSSQSIAVRISYMYI